ncbi:MAG: LTA synthase family protein [Anaerovoracaceae bacterium]
MNSIIDKIKSAKPRFKKLIAKVTSKFEPATRFFGKIYAVGGSLMKKVRVLERRPFLFLLGFSFILYMLVELLSRRSLVAAVEYLITAPTVFLYNWLIVLVTLSISLLFRKREFIGALVAVIWLTLGITNCILLGYRTTPLNAMDFRTFGDVMGIVTVYFNKIQIAGMIAFGVIIAVLIIFIFIKAEVVPWKETKLPRAIAFVGALSLGLFTATSVFVSSGALATTFHNIQDAYKQYGFAYCFACSVVDRGMSKPEGYSQQSVQAILDDINASGGNLGASVIPSDAPSESTPNIVILQMESMFDVKHLKNVKFSEDPLPIFTELKKKYTSGFLTTPSFGAGTANTEFEVNTGMGLDYFGPGEYPYTTVMREHASESIGYILKEHGYSTHAIHDHTGRFYGRNWVYPNLGYDTFTSVEYMNGIERNPLNWVDDSILTGEIMKSMVSTDNQDFVFAVSVQGHGKYPSQIIDPTQTVTVEGFNEQEKVGFEYYVNQVKLMDDFIGEFTDAIAKYDEPTVVVIYGDHLPKFSIEPSDLENNNIYQTEYVIWDNFGLEKKDKDLTTYQLYPYVLNQLDMHNGVMNAFQQYDRNSESYYSDMETLQYDLLYGKNYAYGGKNVFTPTNMQMGIDPIIISDISVVGKNIYVKGNNFTQASKIFINGKELTTNFLSTNRIECAAGDSIKDGDRIEVIQMSSKKTHLSTTGTWIWHPAGAVPEPVSDDTTVGKGISSEATSEDTVKSDISDMKAEGGE